MFLSLGQSDRQAMREDPNPPYLMPRPNTLGVRVLQLSVPIVRDPAC